MIIAKTKLRKIPDKCIKCTFCSKIEDFRKCDILNLAVPYKYNPDKRNWEYVKIKSCPLKEVEDSEYNR